MGQQSSLTDKVITPTEGMYDHGRNGETISKITVHCQVAQHEPEECVQGWVNGWDGTDNTAVSSNYIIGPTGRIGLYIPEEDRSWCSSSRDNDRKAITIEVASDISEPYTFNDAAYNKCILLCADICQRYNFKLFFTGDATGSLTCHYMFSTTGKTCPGTWFRNRIQEFCDAVNAKVENGIFNPDDYDDSYVVTEEPSVYDYYLITSTSKQNQPGECGNKITGSVYLGRW